MTRLTRRGAALLVAAVVFGVVGELVGHPVLRVLAGAALGAVVAAFVTTSRRPRVSVDREVYPERVRRGGRAFARLQVRNTGTRRQPGFTAGDLVGGGFHAVAVRALLPGAESVYHYDLPTLHRGRFTVGPLTTERLDPLGLGRRRLTTGDTATLWVHPRVHAVRALVAGYPRHHHEGRTTEHSPSGSMDLRDVREYVVGDEVRHLHWKATARTGQLMIRDYVDPNQPRFTTLLDTRLPPAVLEEAIDVAASLLAASAAADHRCRLVTSCGVDVSTRGGATAIRLLLDELCLLGPASPDLPLSPPDLARSGGGCLTVVTAGARADDLVALANLRERYSTTVVVALDGTGAAATVRVPGARVLRAADAADAARRWNAVVA